MDQVINYQGKQFEKYKDVIKKEDKMRRLLWNVCCALLFRPFALPIFKKWRLFVLRMFGAKIGKGCAIAASVKIWEPWKLEIGVYTAIGHDAIIYNQAKVILGSKVAISQYAYLCTASHDISSPKHTEFWKPIIIGDRAWVAARAYVSQGVTIGEGAVVGATASVYKDVEPWTVVGGNPAKVIKKRTLINEQNYCSNNPHKG